MTDIQQVVRPARSAGRGFRAYSAKHLDMLAQRAGLAPDERLAVRAVATVLPFRTNSYVVSASAPPVVVLPLKRTGQAGVAVSVLAASAGSGARLPCLIARQLSAPTPRRMIGNSMVCRMAVT